MFDKAEYELTWGRRGLLLTFLSIQTRQSYHQGKSAMERSKLCGGHKHLNWEWSKKVKKTIDRKVSWSGIMGENAREMHGVFLNKSPNACLSEGTDAHISINVTRCENTKLVLTLWKCWHYLKKKKKTPKNPQIFLWIKKNLVLMIPETKKHQKCLHWYLFL